MATITITGTVAPKETVFTELAALKQLVTLYSYTQALVAGMPEATHEDEGKMVVTVNDSMTFSCDGKAGMVGDTCVRHVSSSLGESYVDIASVAGFEYKTDFSYVLELMRTRGEKYGESDEPQYDYTLVKINDVTTRK